MEKRNQLTAAEFKSLKTPKKSKYKNKKTVFDGITFDSKKEAGYYGKLVLLKKSGEISDFKMQVRFPLKIKNKLICTYIADFVTYGKYGEILEVIDVKGVILPLFRIKYKLMEAIHGITVKIV